jgi:hypothetical protein
MRWSLCFVGVIAGVFSVCGNEIDVDLWFRTDESRASTVASRMVEPEEVRFQRDSDEWKWYCLCEEHNKLNDSDLTAVKLKLRGEVDGDAAAGGALDIFLACDYWPFVDCCVKHLGAMSELNRQRFREVLILLAPGLVSTRYMARAVRLVGRDQREVRAVDLQHVPFCLDMFFYGAVRNGQLGRYALANMCIDAFYYPCLKWGRDGCEDERFDAYDIDDAAFDGTVFDDWPEIYYCIESIWPNWK